MMADWQRTVFGKMRGRGLGLPFAGTPGTYNAITDVAGVEVGAVTLIAGEGKLVRDKGPVRRFARDFIDSRRSAAEFFLFGALLILALSILPSAPISFAVGLAWVGMCIVIIVDSILITRRLKREIRARFPNEDSKGVVPYTLLRSMQFRGLRMPKPRVRPGTPV